MKTEYLNKLVAIEIRKAVELNTHKYFDVDGDVVTSLSLPGMLNYADRLEQSKCVKCGGVKVSKE